MTHFTTANTSGLDAVALADLNAAWVKATATKQPQDEAQSDHWSDLLISAYNYGYGHRGDALASVI